MLLDNLKHFYTIPNALMRSQAKHLYLFLTHHNTKQHVLNYHRNIRPLLIQPSHYEKFFNFFSFIIRNKKCQAYQQKKEKQNSMPMI